MSKKKKQRINEYDQNPAETIKKTYKKKRRVRRLRVFLILLIAAALGAYFYSPYSRLQTIHISGNHFISNEEIQQAMNCDEDSIRLFCWSSAIKERVNKIPGIKSVAVEKSIFDGLTVSITESAPIAYQMQEGSAKVIFDNGTMKDISDSELIRKVQSLPQLSQFNDEEILKQFAENFAQVDESVRTQLSDIMFEPQESDPLRVKLLSDDNKESYVRIDDMVYQLQYYNTVVSQNSENCYFDFLGGHVYQRACD